jgi:mono/diheme cytochrome c family protein
MERGLRPVRVLAVVATALVAVVVTACGSQSAVTQADNLVRGKQLFVSRCGSCHTLARAGTKGTVGPDLDAAFRQSLSEGFGRSAVHGVVAGQIRHPNREGKMPADLVSGQGVDDVAAYVAVSVARTGQDTGVLATAVKAAGAGKPAVEQNGTLEIDADPNGQLAYVTDKATAQPGKVTIKMKNPSQVVHDIAIEGNGVSGKGKEVGNGGVSEFSVDLKPGTYTYYCTLPGHRQAGMHGTLTVK